MTEKEAIKAAYELLNNRMAENKEVIPKGQVAVLSKVIPKDNQICAIILNNGTYHSTHITPSFAREYAKENGLTEDTYYLVKADIIKEYY